MKISVIISAFSKDRLFDINKCIISLESQSLLPDEILVVVDPDDDLVTFFQSHLSKNVKIIVSDQFGLSNARNAGIKAAVGDIIVFIDDDAFADKYWLEKLVEPYHVPEVVGTGGLIRPNWSGTVPEWFPEELFWIIGCSYKGLPKKKSAVRNAIGCNMSFRKSIFEKVGYFRTDIGRFGKNLLGSEEPELSTRIFKKYSKAKIVYIPEAIVYHNVIKKRTKIGYIWRRSFFEGLSKALLIQNKGSISADMSTEDSYLKYLLIEAIPSRLKKFYNIKLLSQLLVISLSSFAVFLGYSIGKFIL